MTRNVYCTLSIFLLIHIAGAQEQQRREDFDPPFLKLKNGGVAYIHTLLEMGERHTQTPSQAPFISSQHPLFLQKLNKLNGLNAEVSIAANPNNANNLVAAWMRMNSAERIRSLAYAYTFDGGTTWSENIIAATGQFSTFDENDPVVIGCENNVFHVEFLGVKGQLQGSAMLVATSTDGGVTFGKQSRVVADSSASPLTGTMNDKNWIAVDQTTSPFRDNIYTVWLRVDQEQSQQGIVISRGSKDGSTWTAPLIVNDTTRWTSSGNIQTVVQGANIAVGTEGEVYVTWLQFSYAFVIGTKTISYLRFDKSFDGGVTFSKDKLVIPHLGVWERLNPQSLYQRMNGFPSIAVDHSQGKFRGRIYICYSAMDYGDADVFLVYSDDKGETWSLPIRVNDDPVKNGAQQFFGAVSVSSQGVVSIPYYDTRANRAMIDCYFAESHNGGLHFITNKISEQSFQPVSSGFFGDYISNVSSGMSSFPVWSLMKDNSNTDILTTTRAIPLSAAKARVLPQNDVHLLSLAPNPLTAGTVSHMLAQFELRTDSDLQMQIVDVMGREVMQWQRTDVPAGMNEWKIPTTKLYSGVYRLILRSKNAHTGMKFLVLK